MDLPWLFGHSYRMPDSLLRRALERASFDSPVFFEASQHWRRRFDFTALVFETRGPLRLCFQALGWSQRASLRDLGSEARQAAHWAVDQRDAQAFLSLIHLISTSSDRLPRGPARHLAELAFREPAQRLIFQADSSGMERCAAPLFERFHDHPWLLELASWPPSAGFGAALHRSRASRLEQLALEREIPPLSSRARRVAL